MLRHAKTCIRRDDINVIVMLITRSDHNQLSCVIPSSVQRLEDIPKTIIYVDDIGELIVAICAVYCRSD